MPWRLTYPFTIATDSESPDPVSASTSECRTILTLDFEPPPATPIGLFFERTFAEILGYPLYDTSSPTKMHRTLPLQHPFLPHLWATDIAAVVGRGIAEPRAKIGVNGLPVDAYTPGNSPHRSRYAPVNQYHPRHKFYRFGVGFSCPLYDVHSDRADEPSELYRYVERHYALGQENITREGSSFTWAAGTPAAGTTIKQGIIKKAQKGTVTYLWHHVPRKGLFGNDGDDWPRNIWNGVGKVNDDTFDGCRAGELLVLPPKFTPEIHPGLFWYSTKQKPMTYTVEIPVSYFRAPTAPGATVFGHNLFPTPDPAEYYWYLATQNGAADGPRLYEEYDFNKLFQLMGPND